MNLEIKHLAPYLPYGLNYYPSEESDLYHDIFANNNLLTPYNYISALENNDEFALRLKKSYLTPNNPYISLEEDGDIFLGQFKSSLGYDVDDVYASEVKPILNPLSDISDELFYEMGFADEEDFKFCVENGDIPYKNMVKLFENHFDVFNLRSKNLCILYNELSHGS